MNGADIQLEKGNWSQIHNAILDALAQAPLTGEQFRCLMFLFGRTYGFYPKRKDATLSLAEFSDGTGIRRQHVWRALHQLMEYHVVYMTPNGPRRPATWGFHKYVEQWNFPTVTADGDKSVTADGYRDNESVTVDGYSNEPICNHDGLQTVTADGYKTVEAKEQKEEKRVRSRTRAEVAAEQAERHMPHKYPGIAPRLLTTLTNHVKRIYGFDALIDKPGADSIEDRMRQEAFRLYELGFNCEDSMLTLQTAWQFRAANFKDKRPYGDQLYELAVTLLSQPIAPANATTDFTMEDVI